jgi:hypothetical protein
VKLELNDAWRKSCDFAGDVMTKVRSSIDVFDQEFLPIRAKLLELAASLDRLDRASDTPDSELRLKQIQSAIEVLLRAKEGRAEQVQLIFSRPYENDWRDKLRMSDDE